MKAIDVNGFRYHDIVLYLASLLAALGENVFVRDMTEDLSMSRYLPEIDGVGEGAMLEFKGVGFAQGQMPVPEARVLLGSGRYPLCTLLARAVS